MNEVRYIISDAAKKVSVEPHVLRYWEEELDLKIPRNEMGHRYYREKDIEMLQAIADSEETIVRFQGDNYHYDLTISASDKKAIQSVLTAYEYADYLE